MTAGLLRPALRVVIIGCALNLVYLIAEYFGQAEDVRRHHLESRVMILLAVFGPHPASCKPHGNLEPVVQLRAVGRRASGSLPPLVGGIRYRLLAPGLTVTFT